MTPSYECIKIPYELNPNIFDSEDAYWKLVAQLNSDPLTSNVVMPKSEICFYVWFAFNLDIVKIDHKKMNLLLRNYLTRKYSLTLDRRKTNGESWNLTRIRKHLYIATILPKRFLSFQSWEHTMTWKKNSFGEMKIQKMDYVKYKQLYRF